MSRKNATIPDYTLLYQRGEICKELTVPEADLYCGCRFIWFTFLCPVWAATLLPSCSLPRTTTKPNFLVFSGLLFFFVIFCQWLIFFSAFSHDCSFISTINKALLLGLFLDYKPVHLPPSCPNPVWPVLLSLWPKKKKKPPMLSVQSSSFHTEQVGFNNRHWRLGQREREFVSVGYILIPSHFSPVFVYQGWWIDYLIRTWIVVTQRKT